MTVMRTYLIRFYNADEGKIDETDFCSASFLCARLVFAEWALSEFDILPTILSVTCIYNQEDADEYDSDDWPDYEYDHSLEGDEPSDLEEDLFFVQRNNTLTCLAMKMLTSNVTKDEWDDYVNECLDLDDTRYSRFICELFRKYGF